MPLIEVKNLEKIFYTDGIQTRALNRVSLTIKEGEFVAIMGPSGSGKSTLLHILGFLDHQTDGEYLFEGKSLEDYTEKELAKIRNQKFGFVFQAFFLLPKLNVLENVKIPLIYSQVPETSHDYLAKQAISTVGLSHRMLHESSRLSGGEKQRVAIARALVNNPKVIFADEPTGNLDSKSGQAIIEILKNLNAKGGHTILLITHEIEIARHAKRIIQIKDGRIASDKYL